MAILKCKMCGGDLNVTADEKIIGCEFCGTTQTIPDGSDEKKTNLFNRANRLRIANEFDKAAGIYESIIAEFPDEAESYWGLCLCKFGIEYVDDPKTAKKIPTCHRTSFESIFDDENYKMALEKSDVIAQGVYKEEATVIDNLQKDILSIVHKEEPFDVFICYKETDELGQRTQDSVLAQDIYDALTDKGFKVFFSRITLEDKLGKQYEPYIFAALNSAKVMLAIGTKEEYYNAVWVKNEWSRYLALMESDKSKMLIPCYRDIDPYDMPKEFAKLQAQDMGKVGAIQDLLRGIEKILPKNTETRTETTVVNQATNDIEPLLKRMFMFLEDGNFKSGDEYAEKVLDINPECAEAYLGKLMASYRVMRKTELVNLEKPFDENANYDKVIRFADDSLKDLLNGYIITINTRIEQEKIEETYDAAKQLIEYDDIESYKMAIENLNSVLDYKDAKELKEFCVDKIDELKKKRENSKTELQIKRQLIKKLDGIICAGECKTVAIKTDGTIVVTKNNDDIPFEIVDCTDTVDWTDIVTISTCGPHVVGLKSDGTVVAVGENDDGQCDVSNWTDIVAISASESHTIGLKKDGTVVATEYKGDTEYYHGQCDVSDWTDIVAISTGEYCTIGLKKDGTVVATQIIDDFFDEGQCEVSNWADVVAISAGRNHTVGLKTDGTVVAVGENDDGQCDVSNWTNIVAISAGSNFSVGLKLDGTVVAVGYSEDGRIDVSEWSDIVAISAGINHTVGIKRDGTTVSVEGNLYSHCNIKGWKLFNSFDYLEQERIEAKKKKEIEVVNKKAEMQKQKELEELLSNRRSQNLCQHCGGEFKGLFSKKCVNCGKEKDY